MEPKVDDLLDRLGRLTAEFQGLSEELNAMLPDTSEAPGSDVLGSWTITGERMARWDWIDSRLREIQARRRQMVEQLARIKKERQRGK